MQDWFSGQDDLKFHWIVAENLNNTKSETFYEIESKCKSSWDCSQDILCSQTFSTPNLRPFMKSFFWDRIQDFLCDQILGDCTIVSLRKSSWGNTYTSSSGFYRCTKIIKNAPTSLWPSQGQLTAISERRLPLLSVPPLIPPLLTSLVGKVTPRWYFPSFLCSRTTWVDHPLL